MDVVDDLFGLRVIVGQFNWACGQACSRSVSGTFERVNVVGDLLGLANGLAGGVAVVLLVRMDVVGDLLGLAE